MIPTVMAVDGRRIPLTSLWSHRKIALVFLRHLGCRFCWYQASELRKITDQLTAHEVPLVIIALGTPGTISAAEWARSAVVHLLFR